jgi:hypothetical protein
MPVAAAMTTAGIVLGVQVRRGMMVALSQGQPHEK